MSAALIQPETIARKLLHRPLLSSCAIAAALIASGYATQVRAQAFQASDPTLVSGAVTWNRATPGVETITVSSSTAILSWTPTDTGPGPGNIDYLPAGNVATFTNGASNLDFVVLNRIVPTDPTRAIVFNGTVLSQITEVSKPAVTGGTVWFYSPGGIIAGPTALFDVGSLVLTANDIADNDVGGSTLHFRAAPDSRSAVTISAGAQLKATQQGSYVALVAPRVTQAGTVDVNGSVAYIAAESADLTINGGLFDITVQTGSVVNSGGETTLSHSGTTTGDGPLDATDPQLIYMVAVPKNDAITMLVTGGSVGYLAAGSAGIENGVVILSAGQGVSSVDTGSGISVGLNGSLPGQDATVQISGGDFKSRLTAFATTDALADGGTGTLSFASALDLNAGRNARLTANAGQTITVLGSMAVRSYNRDSSGVAAAGQASIRALGGGSITVDGGATAEASSIFSGAVAGSALFEANASTLSFGRESFVRANGDGINGGTATLLVTNGDFSVGEQLQITANGNGGAGGTASATLVNSDVRVGFTPRSFFSENLTISALGAGGAGAGGAATGGSATFLLDNSGLGIGTVSSQFDLILDTTATGGDGFSAVDGPDGGAGGSATGGNASFTMNSGTFTGSQILLLSDAQAGNGGDATVETATSGNGGVGGAATGGTATFTFNGGTVSAASLGIGASASGGSGGNSDSAAAGAGGNGTGGNASSTLAGGALTLTSNTHIAADSRGGGGGSSGALAIGGAGGIGQGGIARLIVQGASATISDLEVHAQGVGGRGDFGAGSQSAPGGAGRGGDASIMVQSGALTLANLTIDTHGFGGDSLFGASSGEARGGTSSALVGGTGILAISNSALLDASASIDGLDDSEGSPSSGDVFGGTALLRIENGGTLNYTGLATLQLLANASAGGSLFSGAGGNATGGTASFTVDNASFAPTDPTFSLLLSAKGNGGLGPTIAGIGTGGTARLLLDTDGLIDITTVNLDVTGTGGTPYDASLGGVGGSGLGGTALVQTNAGTIAIDALIASADGIGAVGGDDISGPNPGGNGGAGTGGDITLATAGGSLNLIVASLSAQGVGGTGGWNDVGNAGNGGAGTGGSVTFMAKDSSFDFSSGIAITNVSATGGNGGSSMGDGGIGGNGGNAVAGTMTLASGGTNGALTLNPNSFIPGDTLLNDAFGGDGGSGGFGVTGGAGGNGGNATGGIFEIAADLGSVTIVGPGNAGPTVTVNAFAGDGGTGGDGSIAGGNGGNGGEGIGGIARIKVNGGAVILGNTDLTAHGNGGFAGNGGSGPTISAPSGSDGQGTGGTVSIVVDDNSLGGQVGSASLGDTSISVGGFFNDGFDDVGGRIEIYDFGTASGGGLNFVSLNAQSVGVPGTMAHIFDLFSAERRIAIANNADIQLGGPASFRATANGGLDIGGTLNLDSGSFVQIEHDLQPTTPADTISAGDIVAVSELQFNADPDSRIQASGGIDISSNSGGITLNHIGAGGNIVANAPNGVTIDTVDAGGNVSLVSSTGAILVSTDLAAAGLVDTSGTSVTLKALGDLNIDSAIASGNILVDAAGVLSIASSISGLSINLASADIGIDPAAQVGDANTANLSFFNNGSARTFVGGAGNSGGYSLSNSEFATLQAAQIAIFGSSAISTAGPELVVQDLDIVGSASSSPRPNLVGPNASLFIQAPNRMGIEGNVALTSAGSNDLLGFSANRIDMITPAASIVATDPNGGLAGMISMNASRIFVGSDAAAADLASLTSTDDINQRLGINDGPLKPEGYIQADTLSFNVFRSLFIQNSGGATTATRAGFTAGNGGVTISAGEGGIASIVINGRHDGGEGGLVGGAELIPLLSINGSLPPPTSGFDLRSTANGCLIVGQSCSFDMETPSIPPVQDVIDEVLDPPGNEENDDGTAVVQALNVPLIQLVDIAGLSFAPLIDEPVTGAGNDDFWLGDDQKDTDKDKPGK